MDYGLMVCRAVHFTALLTVFGALVFQAMLAPRAIAAALEHPLRQVTVACAVIAALTGMLWLVLLAAMTSDSPEPNVLIDVVRSLLLDTQFGTVWQWHMASSIGLIALLFYDRRRPTWLSVPLAVFLAGFQLAMLGLVGHAAILEGPLGIVNRISLVLHLLAAGFWLGSLIPVALCLRIGEPTSLRHDAMIALRRFSTVGHASVALVVLTGLINMALIEGRVTLDLSTPYRQLLALKIAVVATMIGLAVINRYWLVPRLGWDAVAIDYIRRISIAIYCFGLGAVALVSVFGTLAPS